MVNVNPVIRKFLVFGISCLLIGIIVFTIVRKPRKGREFIKIDETKYEIGGIKVDLQNREIEFHGRVIKNKGEVLYLLYVTGYKWIQKESAITSDAMLLDLQKAIAMIDWKLWDDLWTESKNQGIEIYLKYNGEKINARECVINGDKLNVLDFIFLGSPYYDGVALGPSAIDCAQCPLFSFERDLILNMKSATTTTYFLNPAMLPKVNTKVKIVFKL